MNVVYAGGGYTIRYTDEPIREGVKPCANYMYESLRSSKFDKVVCVVLTGMGADGTEGIKAAVIKVGNATSDMANIVHGNRSTFKAATNVVNAMSGLIGLFKK